ncbi:MAG: glycosyltransferase family 4 protein [Nitrosomonadales bacterium]|nr:glycosyltransferase family 4 protein [Nitrosomonadales bacterium]
MKPIKILTFSSLYPNAVQPTNGIFVENRLRHLLESGEIEVKVVAPVPWFPIAHPVFGKYGDFAKVPDYEVRHGIDIYHPRYLVVPKIGMSIAPLLMARAVRKSVQNILDQGFDFDLIDAHYFYPDGVAACILAGRLGKPFVVTARGTDINLIPKYTVPKRWILWAAEKSRAMISVCRALKDEMVDIGIPAEKITPLRNGVDLNFFRPDNRDEIRKQLNIEGRMLLSAGYLIERKGHHLIIEALSSLPDTRLYIAGDGEMLTQLNKLALDKGVADRVTFLGSLDRETLRRYMVAADALVLASSREGMANVLLESIACGTPVIATPLWGTPEVVAAPEAGILTRDRSVAGIAEGVKRLFANYPDRELTRQYAEKFSWDETTHGQLAIFRGITNTQSA